MFLGVVVTTLVFVAFFLGILVANHFNGLAWKEYLNKEYPRLSERVRDIENNKQ